MENYAGKNIMFAKHNLKSPKKRAVPIRCFRKCVFLQLKNERNCYGSRCFEPYSDAFVEAFCFQ